MWVSTTSREIARLNKNGCSEWAALALRECKQERRASFTRKPALCLHRCQAKQDHPSKLRRPWLRSLEHGQGIHEFLVRLAGGTTALQALVVAVGFWNFASLWNKQAGVDLIAVTFWFGEVWQTLCCFSCSAVLFRQPSTRWAQ